MTSLRHFARYLGLSLLVIAFVASVVQVFRTMSRDRGEDTSGIRLRFAHVTIHPGIIRAYDEVIREYEALHPGVYVEQVPVPLRLWNSWIRTQMVGGTAPDLVDMDRGQEEEFLARYFLPLDPWLESPNPYNADSPLAGMPWRETFVDGLNNLPAYRPNLRAVYGIPLTLATTRVFANADLLEELTGSTEPPEDYESFVAICEKIQQAANQAGRSVVPLAGSNTHALPLLNHLYSSQTQRIALDLQRVPTLLPTPLEGVLAYLRGEWNWNSPPVRDGLAIMEEVANFFVEGFTQLQRDDSLFHFTQGRAVMLASGSWEADTVISQTPFRLIAFEVPLPRPGTGRFGANVRGSVSEIALPPGNAVGVTREGPHHDLAVDFLRFLTSYRVAEQVMRESNRLSCIIEVPPSEVMAAFRPIEDGYPGGYPAEFWNFREAARVYRSELHELFGSRGSTERFAARMDSVFPVAVRQDLRLVLRDARRRSQVEERRLLGNLAQSEKGQEISELLESQTLRELEAAQIHYTVEKASRENLSDQTR